MERGGSEADGGSKKPRKGQRPETSDLTMQTSEPAARTFAGGRYTVRRVLGEGSQKVVYLARDTQLHRNVAISIIKAEGLDQTALDRVRREAQTIAALGTQPNLIAIFDIGEEAGRPYTVSEYAPGGDLRHKLREADGRLPIDRTIAIAQDLCRALALAHAQGVLHRDVKPDNIWFTADGTAKLGDFGLAIAFGHSRVTAPGTLLGTAAYMPPEQALGSDIDARADLYSLGCVLYEMVTGQPPFPGDSAVAVISQHVNTPPAPPSEQREDIPPALEALMMQLLAKAPENRPASASSVLDSLSAIAGGSEAISPPAAPPARTEAAAPRWKPPRVLIAGAAGAVLLGAIGAGIVAFAMRGSSQGGQTSAPLVAEGYVPKLEPRDCPPELKRSPDVRCQDLVVPEDRAKPSGRQVRLLVTVAPSTAQEPGVPLVSNYLGAITGESDLRAYSDVVGITRRGDTFSEPVLACPEVAGLQRQILGLPTNGPEANKLFLDAAEQCGRRLASEGVDLSAYGDNEMADDVRDLAIAMGWRQINLDGYHQGSRVEMLLAARYPGLMHAVVLEEPYHFGGRTTNDIINANAGLQAYFAACHADAACARAFPNLADDAAAAYARYQQNPVVTTTADPEGGPDIRIFLNGDGVASLLVQLLSIPPPLPFIASGLAAPANISWATNAAFLVQQTPLYPEYPWGAYFSEFCEDEEQALDRLALQAAAGSYPLFRFFANDPFLELCPRWPTKPGTAASPGRETTIKAPALILTGALNPYVPPAYTEEAAKVFKDATVAVFPSLPDDVVYAGPPCIAELRLAFLRDPKAQLDIDGCKAQVPPIAFVGT